MNFQSYWSIAGLYAVLFALTVIAIDWLPSGLLDWALFAVIALGLIVEGAVMALNTTRKGRWTPTLAVLVAMRLSLGAYFFWAAGLALFDEGREWRADHPEIVYAVRSIALVAVIAELFVIPYRLKRGDDVLDVVIPAKEGKA